MRGPRASRGELWQRGGADDEVIVLVGGQRDGGAMPNKALLVVIMTAACSGDSSVVEITQSATAPCALSTAPFTISDVAIDGDELVANIATSGSCTSPRFSVCWDDAVVDTLPAQVDLVVTYKPGGGTCEALRTDRVRVDLGVLRDLRPLIVNLLDEDGYNETTPRADFN
jgi:hypothetical protein